MRPPGSSIRRRRGISLIEVLVAALIMAVSLAGLLNVFFFAGAATRTADQQGIAYSLGRNCMEVVRAGGSHFWNETVVQAGYTPQSAGLYYRTYDENGDPANANPAYRVVCEIVAQAGPLEHLWRRQVTVEVVRISSGTVLYNARTYLAIGGI